MFTFGLFILCEEFYIWLNFNQVIFFKHLLTSPYWSTVAPTQELMLLISEVGPTIRDVPVSIIAWHPPEQATVWPLIVTLQTFEGFILYNRAQ